MEYYANNFKTSILVKVLTISLIIFPIFSLFGCGKNTKEYQNYNTETNTSKTIGLSSGAKSLMDQISIDLIYESPDFFNYLMGGKQKIDPNNKKKSMLLQVDEYIKLYPNDWVAYLYYALINNKTIDDAYKSIEYVNKAIKIGAKNEPVAYIIRSINLSTIGDDKNKYLDILKAKSLDYTLKYESLYESWGLE